MLFYIKNMVNNINNFGVINFFENKHSEQKKEQAAEDITPVEPEPEDEPIDSINFTKKTKKDFDSILEIPEKNKYTQVRNYIKERCRFDAEFKQRVESATRVELCDYLSRLFGWFVDPHHLGVNVNRHH